MLRGKASDLRGSLSGADLSRMTGAKSVKLVAPISHIMHIGGMEPYQNSLNLHTISTLEFQYKSTHLSLSSFEKKGTKHLFQA